jgi:hypothetical protein
LRAAIPYFLCVVVCMTFVWASGDHLTVPLPRNATIYDTALALLKEFAANDPRLGLANGHEIDSAMIDMSDSLAVSLVYAFEDSISIANRIELQQDASGSSDSLFLDMHRVIRPVFTTSNGRRKLCSSITFDSTGGVHPIMFDDSTLLLPALKGSRPPGLLPWKYKIARLPPLRIFIYIMCTASGHYVAVTQELQTALGSDFPVQTPIQLQYGFLTKRQLMTATHQWIKHHPMIVVNGGRPAGR